MGRPKIRIGNCLNGCDRPADALGICKTCYKKQYYSKNRLKENQSRSEFNKAHKDDMARRKRERQKVDISYKLANTLRNRLNAAIKGGGSIKYLGCSLDELKKHLEAQFAYGMSWDNHARYGWHIDHIIPLASLDLTIEENLKKVCHYTNLRPLWWQDNLARRYE